MLKQILLVASFSVVIPLSVGVKNLRSYANDRKALTLFLLVSALVEAGSWYLWKQRIRNLPLLHAYTLTEFVFLSYIYKSHLQRVINGKIINVIMVAFVLFSVCNSLFIQSVFEFNSYARGIEFILIIFYAVTFIYVLTMRNELSGIQGMPMFWLNTGVLLYYTMSFFLILLSNNMLAYLPKNTNLISWAFHGIFLLIYHTFLTIALWIRPKQ